MARSAEAYLRNRTGEKPFLLTVGLLQPHDICYWGFVGKSPHDSKPYAEIADELPSLPPNFHYDGPEPQFAAQQGSHRIGVNKPPYTDGWTDQQWRYYRWAYHRCVEMVDGVVGHVLDALEDSPYAENTIVIFASDHGEGQGYHRNTVKETFYDEVEKVPLIFSWPGRIPADHADAEHLVSGVDLAPTLCDYAGVEPMPKQRGYSLRPLLEGKPVEWRDFVAAESFVTGRMIRTRRFKYVTYRGDPVEQLFDMENDPDETRNLAAEPDYASALEEHRRILAGWEAQLEPAPPPPGGWLKDG
ncbi:MAG: sulfatase family protein [Planctomycetota bacterium]